MFIGNAFVAGVLLSTVAAQFIRQKDALQFFPTVQTTELYPDGVRKNVLTYNGLFPGPIVILLKGQRLLVSLNNFLQSGEPTTIHWHGLNQRRYQFEDGPSMVAQCPLPYGQNQVYNFTPNQGGTHWYHSHYSGQYTDGLFGALIVQDGSQGINDKKRYNNYWSDRVVILSDHYHADYKTNQRFYMNTAFPPKPQSALINGHGVYHCRPELPFAPLSFGALFEGTNCRKDLYVRSIYHVRPNKTYRFRVINASAISTITFSIDYHTLWTMEMDGGLVRPDKVTEATHAVLAPGQTYSFLVHMNQPMGKYSIRAVLKHDIFSLFDGTPLQPSITAEELYSQSTTAALFYKEELYDAERNFFPVLTEPVSLYQSYTNFFGPVFSKQIYVDEMSLLSNDEEEAKDFDVEFEFYLKLELSEDRHVLSLVNGRRFIPPMLKPLIFFYMDGDEIPEEANPYEVRWMETVQLIINNKEPFPHPMHLHGHDFWVLGKGTPFSGDYDPEIHSDQLKTAPVKRNVVQVPPKTWVVLRFVADNEGVWPFHCHIDWHYLGGMAALFVSGRDNFKKNGGGSHSKTGEALRLCILNGFSYDVTIANGTAQLSG